MATITPVEDLMEEVAEAERAGVRPETLQDLRGMVEGGGAVSNAVGISYAVPETDRASWVPAWRLSIDHAGIERGSPTKLPVDAIGKYLSKRRAIDGGRLFTLKMPQHLEMPGTFQCFVIPNFCKAKFDTKMNLVDHMEGAHPRESMHYAPQIAKIRESVQNENPALMAIVDAIAATPDPVSVPIPDAVREEYDAALPEINTVEDVPMVLSIPAPHCALCPWPKGAAKWENKPPTQQALKMHVFAKHREEVE